MKKLSLTINDKEYKLEVKDSTRLIDFLRDELGFLSVKEGCGVGECGACTVLMNGEAVNSCLIFAIQCNGAKIETLENLEKNDSLSKLQESFLKYGGIQCGFCTPGILMSAKALIDKNPKPTEEEIKETLEGNLCRCTGYIPIVESIKKC
ncbi:MAG: (2Fe-2S)-binding protein [Melioribacteraceae bacterium]|nr:(2Fe-2S)-binding protein [Melioribacteraceae bacterium]